MATISFQVTLKEWSMAKCRAESFSVYKAGKALPFCPRGSRSSKHKWGSSKLTDLACEILKVQKLTAAKWQFDWREKCAVKSLLGRACLSFLGAELNYALETDRSTKLHFWHQQLVLWKTLCLWTWGGGMVSAWLKCVTCTVHFISILVTSAPPQIIRH